MKKFLFIAISLCLFSGCVSKTKYNEALTKIAELETTIDELANGEERLNNQFNSCISKGDYLGADEVYSKLIEKHPESTFIAKLKEANPDAFVRIQSLKDSIAKAQRDSIRLANIDDIGEWQIGDFVNDFNEPTGKHYIYKSELGSFSNSATANSKLLVTIQAYAYSDGNLSLNITCDEYCNGTSDENYFGTHCKVVCSATRMVYDGSYGSLTEYDENGNSTGNELKFLDLFKNENAFSVTAYHKYSTIYKYSINPKGFNNALLKAGIISLDEI